MRPRTKTRGELKFEVNSRDSAKMASTKNGKLSLLASSATNDERSLKRSSAFRTRRSPFFFNNTRQGNVLSGTKDVSVHNRAHPVAAQCANVCADWKCGNCRVSGSGVSESSDDQRATHRRVMEVGNRRRVRQWASEKALQVCRGADISAAHAVQRMENGMRFDKHMK